MNASCHCSQRSRYFGALLLGLAASIAPTSVSAAVLYSTSFEAPEFAVGPLTTEDPPTGQGGWEFSFGTQSTVTSAFSRTGDQSLVVSGTGSFGQAQLPGPFSTAAPQISVKHSVYLDATADWSNTFITFGLSGPDGFVGQLAIRNGNDAVLRPANVDLFPTAINRGEWIDLELVLDLSSQTQEAFVNGAFIGSAAFSNPATELEVGQLFFTNFDENDIAFYVDDMSITAVPEPSSAGILAFAVVAFRSRRLRRA